MKRLMLVMALAIGVCIALGSVALAQVGQDPVCDGLRGQAKGLCIAAVSEGCFDGVDSQECDDLTTNWTDSCRTCDEEVPWVCPCEGQTASGITWDNSFVTTSCLVRDEDDDQFVVISNAEGDLGSRPGAGAYGCFIALGESNIVLVEDGLSLAQHRACKSSLFSIDAATGNICP